MKRLFYLTKRLGDVICGIPTFRTLRQKYPDDILDWAVNDEYKDVVPKCANNILCSPDQALKPGWNQVIDAHPWHFHGEWSRAKLPLPTFISKLAGINETRFSINIDVSDMNRQRALEVARPFGDFVIINAGPHYSGPGWSHQDKQLLADSLMRKGIRVVGLAGPDGAALGGCHNVFDLNLQASVAFIGLSRMYFGQDCGTSWLACAAHNTPKRIVIDRTPGRVGYDSYVDCLFDTNIMEFPLGVRPEELEKTI